MLLFDFLFNFNFHFRHAEKRIQKGHAYESWHLDIPYSQTRTAMQAKEFWVKISFLQLSQGAG